MSRNFGLAITMVLAGALVAPAHASFFSVGDPVPDNSWLQEFTSATDFTFDEFQFLIVSDDEFAPDPLQDFSRADWGVVEVNARHTAVLAAGSPVNGAGGETLNFWTHFEGEYESDPLTMVWVMYEDTEWRRSGQLVWTGSLWLDFTSGWDPGSMREGDPVPEPATLLLSGLGLTLMGGAAARRRRAQKAEENDA